MKSRRKQRGGIWTKERRDVLAHRFTNCDKLPTDTMQEKYRKTRCLVDNLRDEWNIHYYHPYRIYDDDKIKTIKDQLGVRGNEELNDLIVHLKSLDSFKKYQKSRKSKPKRASIKKVSADTPVTENNPFTEVNSTGSYVHQKTGQLWKYDTKQNYYVPATGEKVYKAEP